MPKVKKPPQNRLAKKGYVNPNSIGVLRKQIRDLSRSLKRENDSNKKSELQKKISDLTLKMNEAKQKQEMSNTERKNATKYHYVKFVEKKKVERKIKHLEEKAELTSEEEQERWNLLKDLEYIKYYPSDKKYVSLFPNNCEDPVAHAELVSNMRKLIEDQLKLVADPQLQAEEVSEVSADDSFFLPTETTSTGVKDEDLKTKKSRKEKKAKGKTKSVTQNAEKVDVAQKGTESPEAKISKKKKKRKTKTEK
eukprot:GCRY01003155.1.p1 GENE.GCRY01003155.1~~GCRY01003155.1.p1  ORF type:complete len:251 (+),score=47.52 GCRY01003155.1:133-885(+)